VRRRGFITVLGGAAAWPLLGHAQLPERVRRVGVLIPFPENDPNTQGYMKAFAQALGRLGWVEGNNIRIDYRFAAGDPTLFKTYATELVGQSPDAILATSSAAVDALRKQTRTIPIVLATVADPVGQGFAQSLARPGGNITGFSAPDASVMGKWLQLLKEIAPRVTRVAVIFNPDTAIYAPSSAPVIEAAAQSLGITVTLAAVHNESEIEEAVAIEARQPGGGLFILTDVFNITHRDAIIAAAAHHMLPLIGQPPLVRAGGLMSYWYDPVDVYKQSASYIDRILRGANPADLPVQQPTKYALMINLKTAKALGLTVPPSMLQLADELIE
jgi:putative ABC transport system substrate-binding protein